MGKNSKKKRQSRGSYVKAVKNAYLWLRILRSRLKEQGKYEYAEEVEQAYKNLWCECLNDPAPWLMPTASFPYEASGRQN